MSLLENNKNQNSGLSGPLHIESGSPSDLSGRTEAERRTYELLDRLGIPFERVDHPPVYTMEDCEEIDALLDAFIVKNLLICNRKRTDFYLLILPDDKSFQSRVIAEQIGSGKLTFAHPEEMKELIGISPGAVSIMGLMNDTAGRVTLLVDEEIREHETIGCHPCVNTASLKLRVKDVFETFLPAVGHEPVFVRIPR